MNLSYWEIKEWLQNVDFTIVGSGIVGLSTALFLKKRFPKCNILILEKGILPHGASTKNAGFACFGSLSEIVEDLKTHSKSEVYNLISKRVEGLHLLRKCLGDNAINFKAYGGYEIFLDKDQNYDHYLNQMSSINELLFPIFKSKVFTTIDNSFQFSGIKNNYVFNQFEGQLDTGKMMTSLLKLVQKLGVKILNNVTVNSFTDLKHSVQIFTDKFELNSNKLILTTNGFTNSLVKLQVQPARAQVLLTKPIPNLHIKGTFHMENGYYYFRNIDNRILFGGGRNLAFDQETTTDFAITDRIQKELERRLQQLILPQYSFEIEHRWSGIMGVGPQKNPIVAKQSDSVLVGVRMGGMGVAIGCTIGKQISELMD